MIPSRVYTRRKIVAFSAEISNPQIALVPSENGKYDVHESPRRPVTRCLVRRFCFLP